MVLESQVHNARSVLRLENLQCRRSEVSVPIDRILQRDCIETEFSLRTVGIWAKRALTEPQNEVQLLGRNPLSPIKMRQKPLRQYLQGVSRFARVEKESISS